VELVAIRYAGVHGGEALSGGGSLGLVVTWNLEVRRGMVLVGWRLLLTVWALCSA